MALSEITNYLEDDWDDNALAGRTSSTEGYFLHPSDGLISDYEAGDALKGVYRPEWGVGKGSPSVSNGDVLLQSSESIETPSRFNVGTWTWDFKYDSFTSGSGNTSGQYEFYHSDTDNEYVANYHQATSDANLVRRQGGTGTAVIDGSWSVDTNWRTADVTRNSFGDFELFLDGASKGTGTDTFSPRPTKTRFVTYNTTPDYHVDNLVVK